MILLRAIMSRLRGQRGGVAILIALGFLVFSIPLITGSLGLAQAISIDARVKTGVLVDDYCSLAVKEFISYLIADVPRWDKYLDDQVDDFDGPDSEIAFPETDVCGDLNFAVAREISVVLQDGDQYGTIPDDAAYAQRDFQVIVDVSDANPVGGDVVDYTITAINRSDSRHRLNTIVQVLAIGMSTDCDDFTTLKLPNEPDDDFFVPDNCGGQELTWDVPGNPWIYPQEIATVEFSATTPAAAEDPVTYCTEAWITPGKEQTNSGFTSPVTISEPPGEDEDPPGACSGEAAVVTQLTDLVYDEGEFSFIDYTITVENIGTDDLILEKIIDLLALDYEWIQEFCKAAPDCISEAPDVHSADRDRLTWNNLDIGLGSGEQMVVKFKSRSKVGTTPSGVLYVDAVASFGGGSLEVYSWPTASVTIRTDYHIVVTDADGLVIVLDVVVVAEDGEITLWSIK